MGTRRKQKKTSVLDKYVIFSFVSLIIYTIVEQVISTITGVSHDVLTTVFFAAFGGETLMCAMIKKLKLKNSKQGDCYDEMDCR